MSLIVILGAPSRRPSDHSKTQLVYLGTDSAAARDACAASTHPELFHCRNPAGYFKRNPHAAANAAALAEAAQKPNGKTKKGASAK